MDVSGSEVPSKFKMRCYQTASEDEEQSIPKNSENQYVSTGEVVALQHLESGAYLTVSEKKLVLASKRTVKVVVAGLDGGGAGSLPGGKEKSSSAAQQDMQEVAIILQPLDKKNTLAPQNLEVSFERFSLPSQSLLFPQHL